MDTASTTSGPQFVGEIGVRGELYIAVDKQEYTAGDTITGRLTVTVSETIQCDTLTLTVIGEEIAQWTERGDHHSRYEEFLRHDILASVLPMPCPPGEYLFPFQYALPLHAPGVLDADSLDGDVQALHATIKYSLKASVKVEGRFVSDLEAVHALVVREAPPEQQSRLARAHGVERTVSKRVRLLGCLSRGTCHVAAAMKTNVLALGEAVRVDIFVNNHTSALAVRSVRCRLYQDVTLADTRTSSRPLLQVKCDGPRSGELLERPIDLVLAGKLRFPTTRGRFLQCAYRVSVECEMLFASTIIVDIPVTILPAQGPLRPLHVAPVATVYAAQQPTPTATAVAATTGAVTVTGSSTRPPPPLVPPPTATGTGTGTGTTPAATAASTTSSRPSSTSSTAGTASTTTTASTAVAPPVGQPFAHLVAAPPHPTIDLMA